MRDVGQILRKNLDANPEAYLKDKIGVNPIDFGINQVIFKMAQRVDFFLELICCDLSGPMDF